MSKDPAGGRRSPSQNALNIAEERLSQSTSEPSPACRATSIDVGQGEGGAAAAVLEAKGESSDNSPEAVKQAPPSIDDVATDELVPVLLARRKWWKIEQAPPPDWLAPFDYQTLLSTARTRITTRGLDKLMLADDKRPFHPVRAG